MIKKFCQIKTCSKTYEAKGYCHKHYERLRTTGNVYIKGIYKNKNFICKVENCDNPAFCKKLCKIHYHRWQRHQSFEKRTTCFIGNLKGFVGQSLIGEQNGNWLGGKSFEPYPLGWTKTFREQIRYRDNYKCQLCGKPEVEANRKLEVHHIDYDKDNLKTENLISLCKSCHMKTNYKRNYYKNLF